jgi:peptidoglycan/LPS O-acetylase OafA/YrhL
VDLVSFSLHYRPDVDGLRTVAVLPVVLFHAGLGAFSGGFVGVDVFFVISGFLITSMIAKEASERRFSIVKFYERRVRRIFPAFFAMLAAACALAWFILPVADMNDFGQSVVASTAFSSNVLFWMQAGYFDGAAHSKPLLHTWSLAVEEQFYIFFPLFLVALYRVARRFVNASVLVVLVASFVACLWMTSRDASTAFYVAPFRAWELLIGSVLAIGAFPSITRAWLRELCVASGLAMIAVAVFVFTEATAFPGVAAALPCVGAALVIHGGSSGLTIAGRVLTNAPAVFIGKISYSLYLWHWPLIVFSLYWNAGPLTPLQTASVLLASFLAAVASWRFVEQPFRARADAQGNDGAPRVARRPLFLAAAFASAFAIVFGLATFKTRGWPQRVSPAVLALDDARNDRSPDRKRCHADDHKQIAYADKCRYGAAPPLPTTVAVWGDSFAPEIGYELGARAADQGVAMSFTSYSACPPIIGLPALVDSGSLCEQHNQMMVAALSKDAAVHTVILAARFENYLKRYRPDDFLAAYERVVTALTKAGKRVVVMYPVPKPPGHVPTLLAQKAHAGHDPHALVIDKAFWQSDNAAAIALLDRLVRDGGGRVIGAHVEALLCPDGRQCKLMNGDDVLYYDENHLSLAGARFVLPAFDVIWSAP